VGPPSTVRRKKLVDVTGIEPVPPCLQRRRGKILTALSGVAYRETDKILALSSVPKLYREIITLTNPRTASNTGRSCFQRLSTAPVGNAFCTEVQIVHL